ncbi:YcjF family protein [Shewanella marinintestina]|uniref:TIGR01620 family protein n=1 Tax=Shewanella marinintestina TaxID=190305 RepID=UPI00200DB534|nr:TIGR01620 family protein [Shewanella marinintestina]MCL1147980.1 YcjF family protein [Shewanella marinintestina]
MSAGDSAIKKQQRFEESESQVELKITAANRFDDEVEFVEKDNFSDTELEELVDERLAGFDSLEQDHTNKNGNRKKSLLAKLCLLGIAVVVFVEMVMSLQAAFNQSTWLFSLYAGVTGLVTLWAGKVSFAEWRKLKSLKQIEDTQSIGNRLVQSMQMGEADPFIDSVIDKLPQTKQTSRYLDSVTSEHNDAEKLVLFDSIVLIERDLVAKKIVRRFAQESALLLAASPLAVLDMAIILWRNQSMINKIAACYGVELGYWSRIKLIRSIIANIIYAGSSEIITDLGTQLLSVEMSGKLSARLGQGLGGGLLTARLGYQAMSLCRPLEFNEQSKPKLSGIHKELLIDLKALSANVLSKTMKADKSVQSR